MRAIVQTRYGSPDALRIKEVEQPTPKQGEVLVRVRASTVNSADVDLMRGMLIIRVGAPFRPKYRIPGSDVAGVVEAVGPGVTRFGPGDEVFGDLSECGYGAFAEQVCAPLDALAPKPAGLTFEEAATLPQAAIIALQGLQDIRPVQAGQQVLVNGAGGGMGTFAVQMAKSFGAVVTGVDSAPKLDLIRSLGADHVIDYATEDFTLAEDRYDLVLDMVGTHSISDYRRTLTPKGALGLVGGPIRRFLAVQLQGARATEDSQKLALVMWQPNKPEDVATVTELVEAGTVVAAIDRSYPLEDVPEAFRYLEAGGVLGKLVISV